MFLMYRLDRLVVLVYIRTTQRERGGQSEGPELRIAPALMVQVPDGGVGRYLWSANICLRAEHIHHRVYLSIGVTSSSGTGLCGVPGGADSRGITRGYPGSCM